ncbi:PAS domain-containing protein, partial [Methanoregula sp.]|uniref:PAS domain-containing protein n=1 Tax=Methanoregula sp. TaxID=2052170 RepID=UPI000CABB2E8
MEPDTDPSQGQLAETLAHYRQMAEFTLDGIIIADITGRILITNPAIISLLELDSTTAAQPYTIFDFLEPESLEPATRDFHAVVAGAKGVLRVYRIRSARGTPREIEIMGNRITYDGGPAAIISVRDVTERRAMEAALQTSRRKFELLANTAIDIINYHDGDLTLTYISPAVRAVLGYEPEECIGRCVLDFVNHGDLPYLE